MDCTINTRQAMRYIEGKGTDFDQARLRAALSGIQPAAVILRPLFDLQSEDGGFPSRPRPGNPSSIDSTLTAILKLDEVGLFPSPVTDAALHFLSVQQHSDGSWDENPDLPERDLAPWVIPGSLPVRFYFTAYSAFWFGLAGNQQGEPFQKAARYLLDHQEESGKIPGFEHNTWLGAGAFLLAGGEYTRAAHSAVHYLNAQPLANWEDSQMAWALDVLTRAGLPKDAPFVQRGVELLCQRQAEDGSWAAEDGQGFAITATLQVLRVIKRCGNSLSEGR